MVDYKYAFTVRACAATSLFQSNASHHIVTFYQTNTSNNCNCLGLVNATVTLIFTIILHVFEKMCHTTLMPNLQ